MPHNLTVTPTAPGAVPVPDPGDARTAASVVQFAQPLANSIGYLQNATPGAAGRTIIVPQARGQVSASVPGSWQILFGANNTTWNQNDVTGPAELVFDVTGLLPPGVTITNVTAYLYASSAHAGDLGTVVNLGFYEFPATVGGTLPAPPTYSNAVADNANHTITDVFHTLPLTVNRLIDITKRYSILVTGESGANSAANKLRLPAVTVTWTAP